MLTHIFLPIKFRKLKMRSRKEDQMRRDWWDVFTEWIVPALFGAFGSFLGMLIMARLGIW